MIKKPKKKTPVKTPTAVDQSPKKVAFVALVALEVLVEWVALVALVALPEATASKHAPVTPRARLRSKANNL